VDYKQILKGILDIGEEMVNSGAEIGRVEDSMYRLCRSYGFSKANCWVISSNIQATVESPDGEIITQIRHVPGGEMNFDRLDYLNNLSRKVCADTPDAPELRKRLDEVLARPAQPKWIHYIAGVLGGTGFAVFFNCDLLDSMVAVIASLIIVALGDILGKIESNPLIFNAIISFIVEIFIIFSVQLGFGHHVGNITVGVVMLMISGIGFTNGISNLLHKDTLSGIINISKAVLGATGIAIGIALPILLMKGVL
jgi:uncharacterized membrane protein YjjP (DUF1212 family)